MFEMTVTLISMLGGAAGGWIVFMYMKQEYDCDKLIDLRNAWQEGYDSGFIDGVEQLNFMSGEVTQTGENAE